MAIEDSNEMNYYERDLSKIITRCYSKSISPDKVSFNLIAVAPSPRPRYWIHLILITDLYTYCLQWLSYVRQAKRKHFEDDLESSISAALDALLASECGNQPIKQSKRAVLSRLYQILHLCRNTAIAHPGFSTSAFSPPSVPSCCHLRPWHRRLPSSCKSNHLTLQLEGCAHHSTSRLHFMEPGRSNFSSASISRSRLRGTGGHGISNSLGFRRESSRAVQSHSIRSFSDSNSWYQSGFAAHSSNSFAFSNELLWNTFSSIQNSGHSDPLWTCKSRSFERDF